MSQYTQYLHECPGTSINTANQKSDILQYLMNNKFIMYYTHV